MEKPVKNVYRIVDQNTNNVAHVVAESQTAAVAFLGLTHVLSVAEVAHAVEIVGTDSPHPTDASAPPRPTVIPVPESQFTAAEIQKIKAGLAGI